MNSTVNTPNGAESLPSRLADGFAARLSPHFVLEQLEAHPASICGLFADGRIAYVNPAWVQFAHENGASSDFAANSCLGQRYLDVIATPLRPFYERLFSLVPDVDGALEPTSHVYECSTSLIFRQFAMRVYALAESAGFVVINTLVASRPHDFGTRVPHVPDLAIYAAANGIIVQCAHCRLVRRADASSWDWVPAWVERMPNGTSHGVCEVCLDYYYPDV